MLLFTLLLPQVISFSPQSRLAKATLVRVIVRIGLFVGLKDTPDKICDQVSDAIVSRPRCHGDLPRF
jgi:hypothetical protein